MAEDVKLLQKNNKPTLEEVAEYLNQFPKQNFPEIEVNTSNQEYIVKKLNVFADEDERRENSFVIENVTVTFIKDFDLILPSNVADNLTLSRWEIYDAETTNHYITIDDNKVNVLPSTCQIKFDGKFSKQGISDMQCLVVLDRSFNCALLSTRVYTQFGGHRYNYKE